jgi:uncharacterized lipoprotein YmbA
MKFFLPLLALFAALLSGCTSASTRQVISLDAFRHVFVEQRQSDNNRIDQMIVAELQRLGRTASSGPKTMMPEDTDAILTYDDRWAWDFKNYLIELTIEVHTAKTRKKLADGRYHQPTLNPKPAAAVVSELLVPLFGPAKT